MKLFLFFVLSSCLFRAIWSTICNVYTLEDIYAALALLSHDQSRILKIYELGRSVENRPIYVVDIHNGNSYLKTVVVEFGIHAREWASQASAMYLIQQLVKKEYEHLITKLRWFIIPVLNPDGYEFSKSEDNMWRKNRRIFPGQSCVGVDLNRNFPVGYLVGAAQDSLCDETYPGLKAFSEPETELVDKLLSKLGGGQNVGFYIAVHGCAQSVLHPYGYKLDKPPEAEYKRLVEAGNLMAAAIKRVAGKDYPVQSAAELYVAGGASDDFTYTTFKVPYVYTLELGNNVDDNDLCFHPDCPALTIIVKECFAALEALATHVIGTEMRNQTKSSHNSSPETPAARSDMEGSSHSSQIRISNAFGLILLYLIFSMFA